MAFSYVQLHPTRRLFLVYFAGGRTIEQALAMPYHPDPEPPGITRKTYEYWRSTDPVFVQAMRDIEDDPDWCHENIVAPWMLAEDDAIQIQKALGIKVDPERPWFGLSAKQRELLLNERGKLNREENQADKFLDFMQRLEKMRDKREQLSADRQRALPAPPNVTVLDGHPGQHIQE